MAHHGGVVVNMQPPFLVLRNSLSDDIDYPTAPVIEVKGLMFVSLPSLRSHTLRCLRVSWSGHHVVRVQYSEMVFLLQLSHVQSEFGQGVSNFVGWMHVGMVLRACSVSQSARRYCKRCFVPRGVWTEFNQITCSESDSIGNEILEDC